MSADTQDVTIIGAGPAGLTAGIFTSRAGLETLILQADEPLLRRNAHLENVPGFPAGVNARRFLDMTLEQATRNGCEHRKETVQNLTPTDDGFTVETDEGKIESTYVICASWADSDYLSHIDGVGLTKRGSKTYVAVEEHGETGVDGLYATGRIAGNRHQTVVAAGDGADVALEVIEESEIPFYHDWVAPEGYFTGRGREVPPGCEEIDDEERKRREKEAMQVMQERFSEHHPEEPTQHPSVEEKEN